MTLSILWFILIAVLWIGYLTLEGFDFGVGMLLKILGRDERERRATLATIGPHWDGNEVWLLTADGVSSVVSSGTVLASMVIFTLLYAALGVVWFVLLRRYIREGVRTPVPDKTGTSEQTDQDGKETDSSDDSNDSSEAAPALSFAY